MKNKNTEINIIWSGPADLGEGPMWHAKEHALYWIDIAAHHIHRFDWEKKQHQQWKMPDLIGALVVCQAGGLIAAIGNEIMHFDTTTEKLESICEIFPKHRTDLRPNDGKCDRAGRFWVGVANLDVHHPKGGLFCLDKGKLTQHESGITISNGLGFSPDDKIFYYTDGLKQRIYQYDFDLVKGTISHRRLFVQLDQGDIYPDGLTVDSEGYLWEAQWNASHIVRYSPEGKRDRLIEMPTARPTSCIFGGTDLKTLFVTTASKDINETTRLPKPAGAVFAITVDVAGLLEPAYQP